MTHCRGRAGAVRWVSRTSCTGSRRSRRDRRGETGRGQRRASCREKIGCESLWRCHEASAGKGASLALSEDSHRLDIDALVGERGRRTRVRVPSVSVVGVEEISPRFLPGQARSTHGPMMALQPLTGASRSASPSPGLAVAANHPLSCWSSCFAASGVARSVSWGASPLIGLGRTVGRVPAACVVCAAR